MRPNWNELSDDFTTDDFNGYTRDVVTFDAGLAGWQSVLNFITDHCQALVFLVDLQEAELPPTIEEIFRISEQASPWLSWESGGVKLSTAFIGHKDVEIYLDVTGFLDHQEKLNAVYDFVESVAVVTGRKTGLYHDGNYQHDPSSLEIFSCSPQ